MAKNTVPEAKDALNRFKMEAANEVGVNLKQGYNGDLTSKQAGSIGGQMVKKMIEEQEKKKQEERMSLGLPGTTKEKAARYKLNSDLASAALEVASSEEETFSTEN